MMLDQLTDKTLVIGYGNPGRQDDGLGPALVEKLERLAMPELNLQSNYQLTVEDALDLTVYPRVVFVDASLPDAGPLDQGGSIEQLESQKNGFDFYPIKASKQPGMGSHSLSPEALLQLTETLYQHHLEAWILAIHGAEFDEFEEKLSACGQANLNAALAFILNWLKVNPIEPIFHKALARRHA